MRIGIIGAGQLAQMLALSGRPLGMDFQFLALSADHCCGDLGRISRYDGDPQTAREFLQDVDYVTFETEHVPAEILALLDGNACVRPPVQALYAGQHRAREKQLFEQLGIPTASWRIVESHEQLRDFFQEQRRPLRLKTLTDGYDGKGQWRLVDADQIATLAVPFPLLAEAEVSFLYEASLVAARNAWGDVHFYPLTENRHRNGILQLSLAPAPRATPPLAERAQQYVHQLLTGLNYIGVLALELFVTADELLANEFAPRVHNSGHWTQDGAVVSQFANHLRAVADLPLGSTQLRSPTAMFNLIGSVPATRTLLQLGNAQLHLYGKTPKLGRKLGHVNLIDSCGDDVAAFEQLLQRESPEEP